MMTPKVTMVVDLQFGSTGKGLICGYWAEHNHPDVVVNCNMPNAGHTYIDSKGQKMVFKCLPNGIVSPKLKRVMIGPGSVFDIDRLDDEITFAQSLGYLRGDIKLMIHPQAMILRSSHKETELQSLSGISSTMQGSAAAAVEKMMRPQNANTAANVAASGVGEDGHPLSYNYPWFERAVCTHAEWANALQGATRILAEGSQGHSLGINAGFYPYCTSRDCSPSRFLSDMGIPVAMLSKIIGTARTYPIRVGNTPDGYSGDHYPDQSETSFEAIGQPDEFTTVTGRKRRIFTFSMQQLQEAAFWCCPTEIFLNFVNYLGSADEVSGLIGQIETAVGVPVAYCGVGPAFGDVVADKRLMQHRMDSLVIQRQQRLAEAAEHEQSQGIVGLDG